MAPGQVLEISRTKLLLLYLLAVFPVLIATTLALDDHTASATVVASSTKKPDPSTEVPKNDTNTENVTVKAPMDGSSKDDNAMTDASTSNSKSVTNSVEQPVIIMEGFVPEDADTKNANAVKNTNSNDSITNTAATTNSPVQTTPQNGVSTNETKATEVPSSSTVASTTPSTTTTVTTTMVSLTSTTTKEPSTSPSTTTSSTAPTTKITVTPNVNSSSSTPKSTESTTVSTDQKEDASGNTASGIAFVAAMVFLGVIGLSYAGLMAWKRYIIHRYGNRELLVNDLEFDTNDLRHFEL